ncbi:MAG: SEC-C metal-binding domain-containing protein [Desulfobulbus sp.]|jgi:hypothetical protein
MVKIGRNQACPCGSGKKYKHCCLPARQAGMPTQPVNPIGVSLLDAIAGVQARAAEGKASFSELGVFLLYSDPAGDAWLLEATEQDAVQLARNGEALKPPIYENPDTIEINFSHTFAIRDRACILTSYADQSESRLDNAPTQQIHAAIRRLHKRFPKELLDRMHVESDTPSAEE